MCPVHRFRRFAWDLAPGFKPSLSRAPSTGGGRSLRGAWPCRDGGIEASIDHEGGWLASKEVADVYSTEEPQAAFHARVAFCLDVHNEVRCPCPPLHQHPWPVAGHLVRTSK